MNATGFAIPFGGSLELSVPGADWHFSIRRADGNAHGPFLEYHNRLVSPADVARFIPHWQSLTWTEIKDNPLLSKSASYAKDGEFKIDVQSTERGVKTHTEVVTAFRQFMSQT